MVVPSSSAPRLGSLVGGTLIGATLVSVGLGMAYLTIATPFVASLVPAGRSTTSQVAFGIWSFALVAGGALLVAGTDRLARTVAGVRSSASARSLVARALRELPDDVVVARDVVASDGVTVPMLAIGAFGVVVLHELVPRDHVRQVGEYWEVRTAHGWRPSEAPVDRAVRDADRVRRWLGSGDLDFVVRVHAAIIAPDLSLPRSAGCAVITPDQLRPWLTALPSQRSLTTARRDRLQGLVKAAGSGQLPPRSGDGGSSA